MTMTSSTTPIRLLLAHVLAMAVWSAGPTVGQQSKPLEAEAQPPSAGAAEPTEQPSVVGAMIFVSPETGELVSVPAAGQMQRLLAIGRSLATRRAAQVTGGEGNEDRRPVLFETPVGIGARLDDRFLHALRVRFDETGRAQWTCTDAEHRHARTEQPSDGASDPAAHGEAPES